MRELQGRGFCLPCTVLIAQLGLKPRKPRVGLKCRTFLCSRKICQIFFQHLRRESEVSFALR